MLSFEALDSVCERTPNHTSLGRRKASEKSVCTVNTPRSTLRNQLQNGLLLMMSGHTDDSGFPIQGFDGSGEMVYPAHPQITFILICPTRRFMAFLLPNEVGDVCPRRCGTQGENEVQRSPTRGVAREPQSPSSTQERLLCLFRCVLSVFHHFRWSVRKRISAEGSMLWVLYWM